MKRINVYDSIYTDDRFIELCAKIGSKALAIGHCVVAWHLAHSHYLDSESRIVPIEAWQKARLPEALLEVGLARFEDGGIYVCGTREYADYKKKKQEAGRKGGIQSGKSRKLKTNEANEANEAQPSTTKQNEASSSSSSSASTSKLNTIGQSRADAHAVTESLITRIYAKYPRKLKRGQGIKKLTAALKLGATIEEMELALANFLDWHRRRSTEPQFIQHFSTWTNEWREWLDESTGSEVTPPKRAAPPPAYEPLDNHEAPL